MRSCQRRPSAVACLVGATLALAGCTGFGGIGFSADSPSPTPGHTTTGHGDLTFTGGYTGTASGDVQPCGVQTYGSSTACIYHQGRTLQVAVHNYSHPGRFVVGRDQVSTIVLTPNGAYSGAATGGEVVVNSDGKGGSFDLDFPAGISSLNGTPVAPIHVKGTFHCT